MTEQQKSAELTRALEAQLIAEKITLSPGWEPKVTYGEYGPHNPDDFYVYYNFESPLSEFLGETVDTKTYDDEIPVFSRSQLKALARRVEAAEQKCRDIILIDKMLGITASHPNFSQLYVTKAVAERVNDIVAQHAIKVDSVALNWLAYHGFSFRQFIEAIKPLYQLDAFHHDEFGFKIRGKHCFSQYTKTKRSMQRSYTNLSLEKINLEKIYGLFNAKDICSIGSIDPETSLLKLPPFAFRFVGEGNLEFDFLIGEWHYLHDKRKQDPYFVSMTDKVPYPTHVAAHGLIQRPFQQLFASDDNSNIIKSVFPEEVIITQLLASGNHKEVLRSVRMKQILTEVSLMD